MATAQAQAAAVGDDVAAMQQDIAAAAQGYTSVAGRQAALRAAAGANRELAAALDTLAAARGGQARAQARASQEAAARGFGQPDQARAALLSPAQQDGLAAQVSAWTETLAGLRAAAGADDLAGLDPAQADEVHAAARAAADALARSEQAEQEARDAYKGWTDRAARLDERLAELDAAQAGADQLDEQTAPVISLAGLAKGMEGQRRVALTTYVLRHWFGQVVAAANVRLSAMSSGRYELRRTDEAGSRRERAGLTLAVIDRHTGAERSPRSLSGGETFYTSLALALGLADVVKAEAGGVDLDTLFIDEGFGALDTDTLDQVMAVIDELRDRGRVVGIVSHLADLKERVPERLEVRRLPDGSSTVRVHRLSAHRHHRSPQGARQALCWSAHGRGCMPACARGTRVKLAEWGRAGFRQARVTKMSVALLAALVLAVTAAGTAAALTTHPSRSPLASQARLPVAYNGLDGWQHGRARLTVIYVGGTTAFLRVRHWSQLDRHVRGRPRHAVGGQLQAGLRVRPLPHLPGPGNAVPGGGPEGRPVLLPDAAALPAQRAARLPVPLGHLPRRHRPALGRRPRLTPHHPHPPHQPPKSPVFVCDHDLSVANDTNLMITICEQRAYGALV